jgi:hypothetical protein
VGARAPRAFAAAADATLAAERAERAAAAHAVAGGWPAGRTRSSPAPRRQPRRRDALRDGSGHMSRARAQGPILNKQRRLVRMHQVEHQVECPAMLHAQAACTLSAERLLPACLPPAPMRTRDLPCLCLSQVPLSVGAAEGKLAARSHD